MKKQILLSVFSICLLSFFAGEALACKCRSIKASARFAGANKVFQGKILSIKKTEYTLFAVFKVETSWKGVTKDKIVVSTSTDSCGESFAVGDKQLLWVNKDNTTDSCDNHVENGHKFLEGKPKLNLSPTNLSNKDLLSQSQKSEGSTNSSEIDNETSNTKKASSIFNFRNIIIAAIVLLVLFFAFTLIIIVSVLLYRKLKK